MGRLARHKKIRACDPFSKQNAGRTDLSDERIWGMGDSGARTKKRSRKSELLRAQRRKKGNIKTTRPSDLLDAPPGEEDDFDINDPTGTVRREKLPTTWDDSVGELAGDADLTTVQASKQALKEERKIHRLLQLDAKVNSKKKEDFEKQLSRKEGETKSAYNRRMHQERMQQMKKVHDESKNPERLRKKKERMKNRDKKGKKRSSEDAPAEDMQEKVDPVRFGERVERPPDLRQLPRGAKAKGDTSDTTAKPAKKAKLMNEEQVRAERNAMEHMRRRVQSQYKLMRQKRNGEFHL